MLAYTGPMKIFSGTANKKFAEDICKCLDMPLGDEPTQFIDWMIHMDTIAVRGDGYQVHVYEVFKEMFFPHTTFYQQQFGYSVDQLFDFFMDLENRVICKICSQDTIYGATKMHDRWVK